MIWIFSQNKAGKLLLKSMFRNLLMPILSKLKQEQTLKNLRKRFKVKLMLLELLVSKTALVLNHRAMLTFLRLVLKEMSILTKLEKKLTSSAELLKHKQSLLGTLTWLASENKVQQTFKYKALQQLKNVKRLGSLVINSVELLMLRPRLTKQSEKQMVSKHA